MGQIIVRNLDDEVIQRLKERARLAQTSLEQTVRNILADAAEPEDTEIWAEIDRLRERIGPLDVAPEDLAADGGSPAEP